MERTFEIKRGDNVILVTVTADGFTRMDVQGSIDFVNHGSAEDAIEAVEHACGGDVAIESKGHGHSHHGHTHTHEAK